MTKEELIKLSRENLRKSKQGSLCECYDEAFIKGYELSEKQIAELEQQIEKMKNCKNCIYQGECDLSGYEECKNFDKWEIKENDKRRTETGSRRKF